MFRFFFSSLFVLSPLVATSAGGETLALKFADIPKLIGERNQHAQGATLIKESNEALRGHLRRSYLPKLSASLGRESFKTGTQDDREEPFGSINASLNLFRGGKDRLEDQMVEARVKSASATLERTLREEIRKARASYWQLISGREIAKLLEETLEETKRNLVAAEKRIRAGAATETDRIEFEMHRIELEQDLARMRLASENAERDLGVLLGLTDGTRIETPATVDHEHTDELMAAKYEAVVHPQVSSLTFRGQEASLKASQFARWWSPSLDVYAGYGLHTFREREYDPEKERYETVVGVLLSLDLFDGLAGRAERNHQALAAAGLAKEAAQTADELQAKVEGARAELKLTHELIHQSEDALKRSKSYLSRTLDEYRRGVKNSPDVLSATERNFAMRRRFAELRRDYQLARAELLETLGK